jgi:serine protease Do
VYVEVDGHAQVASRQQDPLRGTPFEGFFDFGNGTQRMRPQPTHASGSGFIFRPDGYILTNNHVVDGADKVRVILQDKQELTARVVGRDPNTDVAVLKVDAGNLPVAALGDSDPLQVGDWVVALGYPLDLGATVTAGIISAKGRAIGILGPDKGAKNPVEHYIQTDAAINPGNSGGPLVDLSGRVVGINSAIASPTGYWNGYGFAVPIDLARRVAEDLMRFGEVHRPRLGLGIKDVAPADAQVYHLPNAAGAVVTQITRPSPAADAGVQLGDVVVSVNGAPVTSSGDLLEQVARHAPGETVKLGIIRYGRSVTADVALGRFDSAGPSGDRTSRSDDRAGIGRLGFAVQQLTTDIADQLGVRRGSGVVVSDVDPSGSAGRAGLRPGMIIEKMDGQPVRSLADVEARARAVGKAVSLQVRAQDGMETIINFMPSE